MFIRRMAEVVEGENSEIDTTIEMVDALFSYLFVLQKNHLVSLAKFFRFSYKGVKQALQYRLMLVFICKYGSGIDVEDLFRIDGNHIPPFATFGDNLHRGDINYR